MKTEFLKYKWAYFILIAVLLVYVFVFFALWPNLMWQRYLTVLLAFFYFLWGVISHSQKKTINKIIILEYFIVSVLGGVMLFLITF